MWRYLSGAGFLLSGLLSGFDDVIGMWLLEIVFYVVILFIDILGAFTIGSLYLELLVWEDLKPSSELDTSLPKEILDCSLSVAVSIVLLATI